MDALMQDSGDSICFNPSVVRGLGYYTGPVFEIELNIETEDENGEIARFGSSAVVDAKRILFALKALKLQQAYRLASRLAALTLLGSRYQGHAGFGGLAGHG